MMLSRCGLGIHKYVIWDEAVVSVENWYRTLDGQRLEGSDHTRNRVVVIERCLRCDKKRAYRYLNNPRCRVEKLDISFAEKEIERGRARRANTNKENKK